MFFFRWEIHFLFFIFVKVALFLLLLLFNETFLGANASTWQKAIYSHVLCSRFIKHNHRRGIAPHLWKCLAPNRNAFIDIFGFRMPCTPLVCSLVRGAHLVPQIVPISRSQLVEMPNFSFATVCFLDPVLWSSHRCRFEHLHWTERPQNIGLRVSYLYGVLSIHVLCGMAEKWLAWWWSSKFGDDNGFKNG